MGEVLAAQRGLNTGLVFGSGIDRARFLYLQDLTALNPFFATTGTKPEGVVGGVWPELGYLPPTGEDAVDRAPQPLAAGVAVTISDAHLLFAEAVGDDEEANAVAFLQLLAAASRRIALKPSATPFTRSFS